MRIVCEALLFSCCLTAGQGTKTLGVWCSLSASAISPPSQESPAPHFSDVAGIKAWAEKESRGGFDVNVFTWKGHEAVVVRRSFTSGIQTCALAVFVQGEKGWEEGLRLRTFDFTWLGVVQDGDSVLIRDAKTERFLTQFSISGLSLKRPRATMQSLPKYQEETAGPSPNPVVRAWGEIEAGNAVFILDDKAGLGDWMAKSSLTRVTFQTGIHPISIEDGYSVFSIMVPPPAGSVPARTFRGIILKIKGDLTVKDLVAAIRGRNPALVIDEFEVADEGLTIVKRSRLLKP
jgi:hypothetical protein